MEAVGSHLTGVRPLLDLVSLGIADPTAQPNSSEGSPIAVLVDQKHRVRKVVFLRETAQECSRRISAVPTKQRDVENQLCVDVDCSIQPGLLVVELDHGLVDGDVIRI